MSLCGLLNLNKPGEMSSRQAVNLVERLTRPVRAGHAGTLDPLATGVLVVCVGAATRLIGYVQRMPKRYRGTFLLGRQSPTEDIEGEVSELRGAPHPTREQVVAAAARFVGRIEQRPPAFSAVKVAGRRAYELARRGRPPELAARPVLIYGIEVAAYQYPELVLNVTCGSGAYIRSLGRDLAVSLGSSAVMSALVRQAIGSFTLEDAVDPRELTRDNWMSLLQRPLRAIEYLPRVQLSGDDVQRIRTGLTIRYRSPLADSQDGALPLTNGRNDGSAGVEEIAALDPAGEFVGILTPGIAGQLRTLRNMPTSE
jgi:tRNA pseudouridine55 synthase